MKKIFIETDEESYRGIHLLLQNLINITDSFSTGKDLSPEQCKALLKNTKATLDTIKKTLEEDGGKMILKKEGENLIRERETTYKFMLEDISKKNGVPISTLKTFPLSTILDIYKSLFS